MEHGVEMDSATHILPQAMKMNNATPYANKNVQLDIVATSKQFLIIIMKKT